MNTPKHFCSRCGKKFKKTLIGQRYCIECQKKEKETP